MLDRLRDEINETVYLIVVNGTEALFLLGSEGRQQLRIGSRAGAQLPAHRTSGGKVLLAALDPVGLEYTIVEVTCCLLVAA